MKKILFFIPCFYFANARAQVTQVICKNADKKIEVTFNTSQTANLLVLIADSTGHTVFLDNRQNYNGNYKGVLNTKSNKGTYHLKIISDAIRIDKTILPE